MSAGTGQGAGQGQGQGAGAGVTLQSIGFRRDSKALFENLDLHLPEARIGLIGANGSGKSTLLRLIAGLLAPSTGKVLVQGIDPHADRAAALAAVGILFQNPDHQIIFPQIDEELAFGLEQMGRSRAEARAQVAALLTREGLGAWQGQPTAALSQGQRQRLCLLAVLAMGPGTILLDEPFSGLDLPNQLGLARRLAGLAAQVIVVTHQLEILADYDRVIWLDGGAVAADGRPGAVLPAYRAAMAARADTGWAAAPC